MKIDIDLIKNFENNILSEIKELQKKGFQFIDYKGWRSQNGNEDNSKSQYQNYLIISFFNLQQKMIVSKPRKILYAENFVRLPEYENGLKQIEKEIITGYSLFPRLSRKILKPEKQDGMLFDFGIYHLHLGTTPDTKYPHLIQGGEKVLYCLFDDEYAYFLVIDDHERWSDLDLLRIIKDSFPRKLDIWEMKEAQFINPQTNKQERERFRKNGINSTIELDGKFYMPLGGGINMSGVSFQSIRTFQKQKRWFYYIEKTLKEYFTTNLELEQKLNLTTLSLSLQSLQPFTLIDSENKICVEIKFDIKKLIKY